MQHAVGIDDIKTLIGERQSLTVADCKVASLTIDGQVLPRDFDRTRGELNSRIFRAPTRELQKVCPHATADFEQPGTREFIKAHHLRHPRRVLAVTMTFDGVKELARARLVLAAIDGPAGIFAPMLPGSRFRLSNVVLVFSYRFQESNPGSYRTARGSERVTLLISPACYRKRFRTGSVAR